MFRNLKAGIAGIAVMAAAVNASAAVSGGVFITEWMYSGNGGEFVELTNLSAADVDFSGWSYDDDSRAPLTFDLSGLGIVAAGESVIFTEDTPEAFRAAWSLDPSIKVVGGVENNIGRNDEINIYGAFNGTDFPIIDVLTYGDEDVGGPRTKDASGNPLAGAVGANDATLWVLATAGDSYGSYVSADGDIGNPGRFSPVPVPAAVWLFGSALLGLIGLRRRG